MSPLIARRPMIPAPTQNLPVVATPNGLPMRRHVGKAFSTGAKLQQRAFTAAATKIDSTNRTEAQRLKKLRQPWQEEAWEYRDAVGELRYATTYLGNSARRMVLVPSAYVDGELNPVPLDKVEGCPPSVIDACHDALDRLAAGGQIALGGMLRDVTENFEVAGECYLLGYEEQGTEVWEIRSISEIVVNSDGVIGLRDITNPSSNAVEPLPPKAYISRLWWPHPRRKQLADSPFKGILDIAEELLILSRDIRAAGRSRLANNGILLVPDSLTIVRADMAEDAEDSETGDQFLTQLVTTAMAAIQDEGSASAILPVVVRGPAEALQHMRQVTISRQDPSNADKRQELLTRMATSIDLPSEVLTGKADLNHWTSWQVSDDTFRHHIEPIVQVEVDALTLGYYRPELTARQVDEEWVNRIVLWYDPTNLVTHPDRSTDAQNAHDRLVLSDEALRDYMGFEESDAPETEELLRRLAQKAQLDPTIAAQIIKQLDESIDTSGVTNKPTIQLMRPGPGEPPPSEEPEESPPEEQGSPTALPASDIGHRVLELIMGGLAAESSMQQGNQMGGPGSGRYPKGSGKGKGPGESVGQIGVGGRTDINRGMATEEELQHARDVAVQKYAALPEPTDADRARAAEKHARSKRAGGDDRPSSKQRKASRAALAKEFGNGDQCPCVACGRNVGVDSTMSLDRIIPGSDGGSYARSNLVPNCYDCNRVRSNSSFADQAWVKAAMK